jgi:hypothetical protein
MHVLPTPQVEPDHAAEGTVPAPAGPRQDVEAHASGASGAAGPLSGTPVGSAKPTQSPRADFGKFAASADARRVADWVVSTGDYRHVPFLIIDKRAARVFLFDTDGRVRASAPALLGIGRGDIFAPGVAEKDMHETRPEERITPAGRFVGEMGIDDKDKHVLWIDYDAGIALHAVLDNPGEHRRQRLASPTVADNRISYGCVNVPTAFFEKLVRPAFERGRGRVYVLPEQQPALGFFEALARNSSVAASRSRWIASSTDPAH